MKIGSALAIYFIVWWTVLFVILPLRVRSAADTGSKVEEGHDAGAPIAPQLLWKAGVTTLVSFFVFGLIYAIMTTGFLSNIDFSFMGNLAD